MMHDRVKGEISVVRQGRRGTRVPRQPSSLPVEHLAYDWFPLRVSPGKERLARLLLEDNALTTFCPVEVKWRNRNRVDRAKRQKRAISYPWHPGLVFVGMQWPYRWHDVVSVPVVRSVISDNAEAPRRLRHDAIWQLMVRFGEGRFVRPEHQKWMRTGAEFSAGDRVRIVAGPFVDHPQAGAVEVSEIRGNLARVFLQFFGETRGFDIDVADLEPNGP